MYYVYVLWSEKDQRFYIGYTANLTRRISEHYSDKVYTTKRMDMPKLIFYEGFTSKDDAVRREQYFKTTKGKKGLRLILRDTLKASKTKAIGGLCNGSTADSGSACLGSNPSPPTTHKCTKFSKRILAHLYVVLSDRAIARESKDQYHFVQNNQP